MKKSLSILFFSITFISVFLFNNDLSKAGATSDVGLLDDYQMEIDVAVDKALEELTKISRGEISLYSSEYYINEEKILFRMLLENFLYDGNLTVDEIKENAEQRIQVLEDTIEKGVSKYGITVTEDEVTNYITENVASYLPVPEEKIEYANVLGITVKELDYEFDRDLYYLDVFYNKLAHELFDENKKVAGEDHEIYLQRIKGKFYNDIISLEENQKQFILDPEVDDVTGEQNTEGQDYDLLAIEPQNFWDTKTITHYNINTGTTVTNLYNSYHIERNIANRTYIVYSGYTVNYYTPRFMDFNITFSHTVTFRYSNRNDGSVFKTINPNNWPNRSTYDFIGYGPPWRSGSAANNEYFYGAVGQPANVRATFGLVCNINTGVSTCGTSQTNVQIN